MKRSIIITFTILAVCCTACKKDPIRPYAPEDSAVVFNGPTNPTYDDVQSFFAPYQDDLEGYIADYYG